MPEFDREAPAPKRGMVRELLSFFIVDTTHGRANSVTSRV